MFGVTPEQVFGVTPELEQVFGVTPRSKVFGVTPELDSGAGVRSKCLESLRGGDKCFESLRSWSSIVQQVFGVTL